MIIRFNYYNSVKTFLVIPCTVNFAEILFETLLAITHV